ncbi:MAG: hypothetical protein KAS32_04805 [Candidatus Peribacteraceae bacterium]|nr:hypothetical protein [Candidatus Peribacteraceae bacterium]
MSGLGESFESIEAAVTQSQKTIREEMRFTFQSVFRNNKLLKKVFGDKATISDVENFFTTLGALSAQFGKDVRDLGIPFKRFAENARRGKLKLGFNKLIEDLDRGFGKVLSTLLTGFQMIFGVDFSQEIATALDREGGFNKAIKQLFSRMGKNLRKQAIANRPELRKIFTKVMQFFLSPVKAVGFFGKLFGIQALEDFANEFNKMLEAAFGGIFDFVFNLLEGQPFEEAAENAFGKGILPVIDFINELARAAGLIFTILGNIVADLFNFGDSGAGEAATGIIESIFSTLSGFLKAINDLILTPLAEGDLLGAVTNLLPLVLSFLTFIGQGILDIVKTIDVPQIFIDVAGEVFKLLFTALNSGVEELGELLDIDVTSILKTIGRVMDVNLKATSVGGAAGAFTLVAESIVGLFAVALETAIGTLGAILDIDTDAILTGLEDSFGGLITAIENLFLGGEDGVGIFDNIAKIINNLIKAIGNFFALFTTGDASDTTGVDKSATALQTFANALGVLLGLGIDTLTAIVVGLDELFAEMAEADPDAIILLAAAIFSVAAALGTLNTTAKLLGNTVKKFAFIVAALLIVKNIAKNLTEIFEIFESLSNLDLAGAVGDFLDAIGKIFTDIAFDALGLIGIEDVFGFTREDMKELVGDLTSQITLIGRIFGDAIGSALEGFGRWLNRAILDIRIVIGDLKKTLKLGSDKFEKLGNIFRDPESIDIADFVTATGEFDQATIKQFAEGFREKLNRSFVEEFGEAEFLTDALKDAIDAMNTAGALDDLIKNAIDRGDLNMVRLIMEGQPDVFEGDSLKNIGKAIFDGIEDGIITEAEGIDLLLPILGQALLTGEDELVALINAQIEGIDLSGVVLPEETVSDLRVALRSAIFGGDEEGEKELRAIFDRFGIELSDSLKEAVVTEVENADIVPAIVDLIEAGFSLEDIALNLSMTFPELTQEDEIAILEKAQAIVNGVTDKVAELSDGQIVRVHPDHIEVDTTDTIITTADGTEGIVFDTPVTIEPTEIDISEDIDISELVDPEEAAALNLELEALVTKLQMLQTEFMNTQPLLGPFIEELNLSRDAIVEVRDGYTSMVMTILGMTVGPMMFATLLLKNGFLWVLDRILTRIFNVRTGFTSLVATVTEATGNLIKEVLPDLKEIENTFLRIAGAATAAALAIALMFGTTTPGGDGGEPGNREFGGPVRAKNIYEVNEGKKPEILKQGGKTYLLPGQDGTVSPIGGIPNRPLSGLNSFSGFGNVPTGGTQQQVGSSSIVINQGNVIIGDISGTDLDNASLVGEIQSVMEKERDKALADFSVNDKLRSRHRI